ncbi:MAG: mechanosensitive ion channel [Gemmatimonadota bacterium]|nr:mechanosensitive ion channel [Gemmatimonadota bacterium]MDH3423265.1 mechanosensitive ion channel [Gemmatimonadota bacterium]
MSWVDFVSGLRQLLDVRLFEVSGTSVTVASVVTFVVLIVVTFWVSKLVQQVVGRMLARGGVKELGTVQLIQRGLHYLVLVGGVAVALQTIGISLAAAFAAGAVVAVGVGFAMQNILQNFVSGVILLAERTIKETDILEVNGRTIRVERIGTRSTVARTRNDEQMIIPNSDLVQSVVTNYTLADSYSRVMTDVGVSYSSDMRRVREVVTAAAAGVPGRIADRDPVVYMLEFGDSAVVWGISIWSSDPWTAPLMKSQLNEAVWFALKDADITIAFPQVDVHFPGGAPA